MTAHKDGTIAKTPGVCFWSVDFATGRFLDVSLLADAAVGYPAGRLCGERPTWARLLHPEERRRVVEAIRRAPPGGPFLLDFRIVKSDGEVRWLHCLARLVPDDGGRPARIDGFAEEQDRLQSAVLAAAADAIVVTDIRGVIQWVNPAFTKLCGYSLSEAVGKTPRILCSGRHEKKFYDDLWDTILSNRVWRGELINRRKDGSLYAEEQIITPVANEQGGITHFIGIKRDMTERKEAESALRQSEERYALAARATADGLWDWNLETGGIYFSPRWRDMVGLNPQVPMGTWDDWLRLVHPEDQPALRQAIDRHEQHRTEHFKAEYRIRHTDGSYRWMLCRGLALFDEQGKAYRMAGSQADVTDRRLAEDQLLYDAFHDSLTALPNRALLVERLSRLLTRLRRRREYNFAVIFLDLDRFKNVNDSLGHLAGDQLLVTVSRRLQRIVRPTDTVARFAGDEFTILLDDLADPKDATYVAERIQTEIQKPVDLEGRGIITTCSMGIVLGSAEYSRPDELLRDADTALYRSKALGRGQFQLFDKEMHQAVLTTLDTENDLRRAIKERQFRVFYHPIYSLDTGRIVRVEALVRWPHPKRGLLEPADFIPTARDSGLMQEICLQVLEQSCRQLKAWQAEGLPHFGVNVNLCAAVFFAPGGAGRILALLDEIGIDAGDVEFEVTETVLMKHQDGAALELSRLRERGHKISLDNFGAGLSSLSYLHRFPIDLVKIDKSFVAALGQSRRDREVVRAIVAMCNALGIETIAEGIENSVQLEAVIELGCRYGQGFHFCLPAGAEDTERLLRENPRWKLG